MTKLTVRDQSPELSGNDSLYRKYLLKANDPIIILDLHGVITFVNDMALKLTGYGRDELVSHNIAVLPIFTPASKLTVLQNFAKRILGNDIVPYEVEFIVRDGSHLPIEINASLMKDGDVKLGVMAILRDLRSRKKEAAEVRDREARYRTVAEQTGSLVYEYNVDQGKIFWFGAITRVTGFLPEEYRSVDYGKWLDFIHPDDRRGVLQSLEDSKKRQIPYRVRYRYRRKDGSYTQVQDAGTFARSFDGSGLILLGAMKDISDIVAADELLKNQEKKWQAIYDFAPDAIYIIGFDGVFIDGNAAAIRLTGYDRDQLVGKYLSEHDLISRDQLPKALADIAKCRMGGAIGPSIYHLRRKDGRVVDIEIRAYPVTFDGKQAVLGIARDISVSTDSVRADARTVEKIMEYNRILIDLIGTLFRQNLKLDSAAGLVTAKLADVVGVNRVSVWMYDTAGTRLNCIDLYSRDTKLHSVAAPLECAAYPSYFSALGQDRIIDVTQVSEDPRTRELTDAYFKPLGIKSLLDAPIRVSGKVVGVLSHEHTGTAGRVWTENEIGFAAEMADQIAQFILTREHASAREELSVKENTLSQIMDTLEEGIIVFDRDLHIERANNMSFRIFRIETGDTARLEKAVRDRLLSEDGSLLTQDHPLTLAVTAVRNQHSITVGHILPDGKIIWLELSVSILKDQSGLITAVTVSFRDISEVKTQSQQMKLLRQALKSAVNSIVITDHEGIIVWTNEAFSGMTGYAVEEAIGQNPRILKSGKQSQEFYKQLWDTVKAGNIWKGEIINKRKDGSLYTEEMTISPVKDGQGTITNFIAIKENIGQRKQIEMENVKKQSELETMNKLMVGRELKMIELKKKMSDLENRLSRTNRS